jgi:hypothetical protein
MVPIYDLMWVKSFEDAKDCNLAWEVIQVRAPRNPGVQESRQGWGGQMETGQGTGQAYQASRAPS